MSVSRGSFLHLACVLAILTLALGFSGARPAFAAPTLEAALDTPLTITTGGDALWVGVDSLTDSHDGVDYAVSGVIGDNGSSWFQTTVTGPGKLRWYSGTSSESGFDTLEVSDNGIVVRSKSGAMPWAADSYDVPLGNHTIRWDYNKDFIIASGSDRAFVDQLSYTPNTGPTGRTDGAHLEGNEVQLLPTSPASNDLAGSSVAISNNTLASGAYEDDTGAGVNAGSVSIYKRVGGIWQPYQLLTANDEIENGRFGVGVALDGSYLSVANPSREKIYTYVDNGLAFVPLGGPLAAPQPSIGFGGTIAQSGTTLVAGCRAYNGYVGRVYVYVYNAGWEIQQVIDPPDGAASDQFGLDVDIDGDRLIVGAPGHQHAGAAGGAAYVYDRTGVTWALSGELNDADGVAADDMGNAVAVSGNTAVVGEPNQKTVDVFTLDGTWSRTDILTRPTTQTLTNFGNHVAIDGDVILSGDGFYDGATAGGTVFAYARANSIFFDLVETIQPAVPDSFAQFGDAVDIDGSQFAVGSRNWAGPAGSTQGSAYAYDGSYYHVMAGGTLEVPAPGLLSNDVDTTNDPISVASNTEPAQGLLNVNADGSFGYAAEDPSPAEVSFTYTPSDMYQSGVPTTAYITVAPAPAGDPVFNYGSDYVSSTTVGIGVDIDHVKMYRTRIDSGAWSSWSWMWGTSLGVTLGSVPDGPHAVHLEVKGSGGSRAFNKTLTLDTVKPLVDCDGIVQLYPGDSVHVTATDVGGSGVKRIGYRIDGEAAVYTDGSSAYIPFATPGAFETEYWAEDNAGNTSLITTETFTVSKTDTTYTRFDGKDRLATAIKASKSVFASGECTAVVIATGMNYPDALSGAGLAGAANAPILLASGDTLRADVKAEIKRVTQGRPSFTVYILGGSAAVSAKMEASIKSALTGESVKRFPGSSRYATAQLVAAQVKTLRGPSLGTKALLISGLDYIDGLLVGPAAFEAKVPILLVNTTVDGGLKTTLKTLGTKELVVLGTAARIPTSVETSLKSAVPGLSTRRASSLTDTYARSAAAAEYFANPANGFGLTWSGLGISTAQQFPDGLGAGCAEGKLGTGLLLTKTASLPSAISSKITAHKDTITTVRFYGGTAAVSAGVETKVKNLLK